MWIVQVKYKDINISLLDKWFMHFPMEKKSSLGSFFFADVHWRNFSVVVGQWTFTSLLFFWEPRTITLQFTQRGCTYYKSNIGIIAHFKQNFYSGPNNLAGAFLWNIHFLRGIASLRNCFIKAHAKCKTSLYVLMEIDLPLGR